MENKDYYLIVDFEISKDSPFKVLANKRMSWLFPAATNSFEESIEEYKKYNPSDVVVQYVNAKTGETVKGPKYDTTTMDEIPEFSMKSILSKEGVKQKQPTEPMQYEPRDRFQESNMELTKFKTLIRECLDEVKLESNPKLQLKEALRGVVRNVLREISNTTKPEPSKEEKEKIQKGFSKDGNERLDKENNKLQKELETLVHNIDSDWNVYWDDHNDLNVDAKNLLRVRITPKFENNFDIDAMVKLVDRLRVIGVTWDQVKSFVKANFTDLKNETSVDVAKSKSLDGYEDKTGGKDAGPRHDITKIKKVSDTKKDNKDYTEKQVEKDEDQPDQPMADVKEKSLNKNIQKTTQVKPPKHKSDENSNKLKTDLPGTKKFRVKKS